MSMKSAFVAAVAAAGMGVGGFVPQPIAGGGGGGVTPLPENTWTNMEVSGYDQDWVNQTIQGSHSGPNASDGLDRMRYYANVLGTGAPGTYRMVRSGDELMFSGNRAELSDSNGDFPQLALGQDYWIAQAINPEVGNWTSNTGDSADQSVLFQCHQVAPIGNGPTWGVIYYAYDNSLRFDGNFDDGVTGANSYNIGTTGAGNSNMVAGQWTCFIVHFRLGNTALLAPRTEIYTARSGSSYSSIAAFDKNFSAGLKLSGSLSNGDYLKSGFYKWTSTSYSGGRDRRAAYFSPQCFGQGANKLNEAIEFLKPYNV